MTAANRPMCLSFKPSGCPACPGPACEKNFAAM